MTVEETADFYSESDWAKVLRDRGRTQGQQEARTRILLALLRTRFGQHPDLPALADQLSHADESEAIEAIVRADRPEDIKAP